MALMSRREPPLVRNIVVEGIVGMVPVLGDLFDAGWKANQRNVRLLDAWLEGPARAKHASRALLLGIALALIAAVLALFTLVFVLIAFSLSGMIT
jgi:hypothetical protein